MNELIRPAIFLSVGLLLGIGVHASFQKLTSPVSGAEIVESASEKTVPAKETAVTAVPVRQQSPPLSASGTDAAFSEGRQIVKGGDTSELLSRLAGMPDSRERDDFLRGAFMELALRSPEEAMELALQIEDPRLQNMAVKTLALEWAFADRSMETADSLETAMFGAALALASTNPEKAALLARTNLEGRSQAFALASIGGRWASEDPQGALDWVMSLPEEERDGRLMSRITSGAAATDPQLAATYLDQLPEGRMRQWNAGRVAEQWFQSDPQGAIKWASTLSDPEMQRRALREVADQWAETDPQAAITWAQTLPDDQSKREAVGEAAREWTQADPVAAARYATNLAPGDLRVATIRSVASSWASADQGAARQWAESLPAADREAAINSLERRGRGGRR